MEQTKIFVGEMDATSAPEMVAGGDFLYAENYRPTLTVGQDSGYGNNLEGNREILGNREAGEVLSVGVEGTPPNGKIYNLVYNEFGNHVLIEFDPKTNTEEVLFTDKRDTDNVQIMQITSASEFRDFEVFNNKFLICTDGTDVFSFNLEKLRLGYGRAITRQDIILHKTPPRLNPTYSYKTNTKTRVNNLSGRLLQFKYQFLYDEQMYSVMSGASVVQTPNYSSDLKGVLNMHEQNYVVAKINIKGTTAEKVLIYVKTIGSDYGLFQELDIRYIKSLANVQVDLSNGVYEGYEASTGTYSFAYSGDTLLTPTTTAEIDLQYDNIPEKVNSLRLVNSNVLALGGIAGGKDRPEIDLGLSVRWMEGNHSTDNVPQDGLSLRRVTMVNAFGQDVRIDSLLTQSEKRYNTTVFFRGEPKHTDAFVCTAVITGPGYPAEPYKYNWVAVQHINLSGFMDKFFQGVVSAYGQWFNFYRIKTTKMISATESFEIQGISYEKKSGATHDDLEFRVEWEAQAANRSSSLGSIKKDAKYSFAVGFRDEKGRNFPLVTGPQFSIDTYNKDFGGTTVPVIDWNLLGTPPEGAASVALFATDNLTYTRHYKGIGYTYEKKFGNTLIDISSFKWNNSGTNITDFKWNSGDKVRVKLGDRILDLDLVSYKVDVIGTETKNTLHLVEVNGEFDFPRATYFEIYTPKKQTTIENQLFRKVTDYIPIDNGNYENTSGSIFALDVFTTMQQMYVGESYGTIPVFTQNHIETMFYENVLDSTYYNYGDVRIYNDEDGPYVERGTILFSDVSIIGTRFSGLNRFYRERRYGEGPGESTDKYGLIQSMQMVGSYLRVVQEICVGTIPVYRTIVEDAQGSSLVTESAKIFGSISYETELTGAYSSHKAVTRAKSGAVYFYDTANTACYRIGNGLQNISGKMVPKFARQTKHDSIVNTYFDEVNEELNLIIDDYVYIFSERSKGWTCRKTFKPKFGVSIEDKHYAVQKSTLWVYDDSAPRNSFFGVQYPTILEVPFNFPMEVKWQNISVATKSLVSTTEDGISTSEGQVSDLINTDFRYWKGHMKATFLRDKATGLFDGKFLRGNRIRVKLKFDTEGKPLNLLSVGISGVD